MKSLCVLTPTYEPKVTDNIDGIISMIQKILDNKNAYINENHVLFDVTSFSRYGELSNRNTEEIFKNRIAILNNMEVEGEIEVDFRETMINMANIDYFTHRAEVNQEIIDINQKLSEVNSLPVSYTHPTLPTRLMV